MAVRRRTIAYYFGIYFRAACLRVLELLNNDHARAGGDHEPVPVLVVGPGCFYRIVIEFRRQRTHRVEKAGEAPVLLFTPACKNQVLLAVLDLLHRNADTVCARRTGRGYRVIEASNFERRSKAGRD